jgi:hypothetical protein
MVDRCWPQRYNHTARREVVEAFAPQVQNGHILDQTVWNYYFEKGTDQLNSLGQSKLDYMVRRRPAPDTCVYLATARDIPYDPVNPGAYGETRKDLDGKRVAAIQKYLNEQMVGRPLAFNVMIHDPFEVGMPAEESAVAARAHINAAIGTAIFTPGGGATGAGIVNAPTAGGTPGGVPGGAYPGTGTGAPGGPGTVPTAPPH